MKAFSSENLEQCRLLVSRGFPGSSAGKKSTCKAGDLGSTPGSGRFTGEGIGYPLQYSGLENSMDCIVYGISKSPTGLSNFHFPSKNVADQIFI